MAKFADGRANKLMEERMTIEELQNENVVLQ